MQPLGMVGITHTRQEPRKSQGLTIGKRAMPEDNSSNKWTGLGTGEGIGKGIVDSNWELPSICLQLFKRHIAKPPEIPGWQFTMVALLHEQMKTKVSQFALLLTVWIQRLTKPWVTQGISYLILHNISN